MCYRFPRFHRRGLIEGGTPIGAALTPLPRVFRGFTAAASLKAQHCWTCCCAAKRCFPRFHRRGLIEGRRMLWIERPEDYGVFRGFTAAASLKGADPKAGHVGILVFRGFTAAASLKDFTAGLSLSMVISFPRFHRRGLIEGAKYIRRGAATFPFSAVSPPRPH